MLACANIGYQHRFDMQIRGKIKTYKAAFLSGKAFKRMEKGDYRSAAIILRKICREIPNEENIEFLFYSLGQCHYKLGQLKTAIKWLSNSYDLYQKGIVTNTSLRYRRCYRDVVELYSKVLRISGNADTADKIINDLDFGS